MDVHKLLDMIKFEHHIDGCDCNYCKSDYEKTPLGYAKWHCGYFPDKESSISALKRTLEVVIDRNQEEGDNSFESLAEFQRQCIKETENFKNTDDIFKKRGWFKDGVDSRWQVKY